MRKAYHISVTPVFADSSLPESKICPVCGIDKFIEQYSLRKDGRYEVRCKDCIRAADRERNHKRRPLKGNPKINESPKEPLLAKKQCFICGAIKPTPDFDYSSSSPDKRASDCKECRGIKRNNKIQPSPGCKVCPDCGVEKNLGTDFYKYPNGRGYVKYCNQCSKIRRKKKYTENIDQYKEIAKLRQSNPKYIEYHREKERIRYNTIPGVAEKARKSGRVYRKANPMKKREANARRQARKSGNQVGRVSYKRILERDGYWCHICKKEINPTIKKGDAKLVFDHIIPLIPRPGEPQGEHSMENIHPAHHICNSRKKNKPFHLLTPFDCRGTY